MPAIWLSQDTLYQDFRARHELLANRPTLSDNWQVNLIFVEMVGFTEDLPDYFPTDEHYQKFQTFLMKNHQSGGVLQGTGGLRKVRWPDARRGKGKRGGLRILYLQIPEVDKSTSWTSMIMSTEQRKKLSVMVERIRTEELKRKEAKS